MYLDPKKIKSARERRAMSQENLANQARVNVRTIQRAEGGLPIRAETLAEIAAVLGVPPAGLLRSGPQKETEVLEAEIAEDGGYQVLKRVEKAEQIISTLERAIMSTINCSAEPDDTNMDALKTLILHLEALAGDPCIWDRSTPLRFKSLVERLEAVASLNAALALLERQGIALYMAASQVYVKRPYYCEEGYMITSAKQLPEYATGAQFLIAAYNAERVRTRLSVNWPLPLEEEPEWGEDDDVPF